jgi:hypothetical protein
VIAFGVLLGLSLAVLAWQWRGPGAREREEWLRDVSDWAGA